MSDIFISYRREDSAPYAGRICDRLGASLGAHHVFMDVEDIAPGVDFTEAVGKTVGSCNVLVVVIGPRWLELLQARAGEQDYVKYEITTALRRGVSVIPVLVGGAAMPGESDLPAELAPLARRQAVTVRNAGFDQDASILIQAIRHETGTGRSTKRLVWAVVAAGIVIALVGSAFLLTGAKENSSLNGAWIARMQRPGQRPYSIRLHFELVGRTLTGQVEYPTGSGAIQDGSFAQGTLTFFTRHIPQFENEAVQIVFRGELRNREMNLAATMPDGAIAKGVAKKVE